MRYDIMMLKCLKIMTNGICDNMEYRCPKCADSGFDDAHEEYAAMRNFAQNILARTNANDIMDTLLVMANVCETRALFSTANPEFAEWYGKTANMLRAVLVILNRLNDDARPNIKLENPLLYLPDIKDVS